MLVLLGALPYLAGAIVYSISCWDLFGEPRTVAPSDWTARLFLPVLLTSLAPLAAAGSAPKDDVALLLTIPGAGVTFTVVLAAFLRDDRWFFRLELPVGIGDRRVTDLYWWMVVLAGGIVVMVYGAVVNLLVIG